MYLIIPAIEYYEKKCRTCIKGIQGTDRFYRYLLNNPSELCRLFRLENVKTISVIDSDSFLDYSNNNFEQIAKLTKATSLPFKVIGNFKTYEDCSRLLDNGIHRVVISGMAVERPDIVKELIKEYSIGRISFYLPIRNQKVHLRDIEQTYELSDYIQILADLGASRVIFTQLEKNTEIIESQDILEQLKNSFLRWTYQYNAKSYNELRKIEYLTKYNMDSIIIGDSFYSINFPCQNIWRIAESKIEVPQNKIICDF